MESWVKRVAMLSEQPVDWYYASGRACILALGDLERVYSALRELKPDHDRLQTEAALKILPDLPFTPSSTLYAENEINTAHEWTRERVISIRREIEFVTNGPIAQALGISGDRLTEIDNEVQARIKQNASIKDIVTYLNEREDLTDAEWTTAIFALGYFDGARSQ